MNTNLRTMELTFERHILAHPGEVFDAWLNPAVPGTPWYENDTLIFNPVLNGLFYWLIRGNPHYGRFTVLDRPHRIQHTWMSRSTLGYESNVTLTFREDDGDTLLTLVHSGLPEDERARAHEAGWNYFLDKLTSQLGSAARP